MRANVKGLLKKIWSGSTGFILQEIIPHIHAYFAEKKLEKSIDNLKNTNFEAEDFQSSIIENLERYHEKEIERKNIIEDKGKSSLFVIALSITLILGSLDLKGSQNQIIINNMELSVLTIGLFYLLLSGVTSIKAINIRYFFDVALEDIINENKIDENKSKLSIKELNDSEKFLAYYKNIKLNHLITNIKSNYVYVTFIGIRNSIILITTFFIMVWLF